MLSSMRYCFAFLSLLLDSCSSSNQLQVQWVSVPLNQVIAANSASEIVQTARKSGGKVRTWKIPVSEAGDFAFADQKRSSFVTAYDPPTASYPKAKPVEYDSKMVGVAIQGKVAMASQTRPEVRVKFQDIQKTGVIRYGPDVEQPVFLTRSLDTTVLLDGSEWTVQAQPTQVKDTERHFLMLKAQLTTAEH